ncbi:interleukin-26 [Pipra filicauda]|uniref:Interleukin family protein n=1 Tax=Pipra filicauda TaxID=649802 RepID=A0A7R5L8R5_9PASS|nr:interleukin-26 [Pipra filicauda]
MKICSIFRSGHFLFLLCLFTVEGKKSPTGKHTCRKELLSQVTENLYIKATSLKSSVPKDLIKTTRLLKKSTKMLFMTNCSVRDQLLSFYVKNVFSRLEVGRDKLNIISAFQVLQVNMDACLPCAPSTRLTSAVKKLRRMFFKLGDKGIYKAIHELDILLPWIQAYIQTIV